MPPRKASKEPQKLDPAFRRTARFALKTVKAGLTPSLVSYFFWNAVIYAALGSWSYLGLEPLDAVLCNIPAQYEPNMGQYIGCPNCKDALLMCAKSVCWRAAVNITYQLYAKETSSQYHNVFQEASLDLDCNQLVQNSDDAIAMLSGALQRNSDRASLSSSCVTFHCKVLMTMLTHEDLSGDDHCNNTVDSKPPGNESDCICASEIVTPEQAARFTSLCGSMATSLPEFALSHTVDAKSACFTKSFRSAVHFWPDVYPIMRDTLNCTSIFGTIASIGGWFLATEKMKVMVANKQYPFAFYVPPQCNIIMCYAFSYSLSKSDCSRALDSDRVLDSYLIGLTGPTVAGIRSICDDYADVYPSIIKGLDRACEEAAWSDEYPDYCPQRPTEPDPGGAGDEGAGSTSSKALTSAGAAASTSEPSTSRADAQESTSRAGTSAEDSTAGAATTEEASTSAEASTSRAGTSSQPTTSGGAAETTSTSSETPTSSEPSTSQAGTTSTPVVSTSAGAVASSSGAATSDAVSTSQSTESTSSSSGVRRLEDDYVDLLADEPDGLGNVPGCLGEGQAMMLLEDSLSVVASSSVMAARVTEAMSPQARRHLQDAAKTSAVTDPQDWSTTSWSKCTCLQQCTPGVTARSVTCPAGVTCVDPKPSAAMACRCRHCANCYSAWLIYVFAFGYWSQAVIAFFLWWAFWSVSMLEEDDLSDMRCGTKCLGFWCKFLPVTLRVFTYAVSFGVLFFFLITVLPIGTYESDCRRAPILRIYGGLLFLFWLLLILSGVYMRTHKPVPPWLHNALPDGFLKVLCAPIRAIGP